MSRSAKGKQMQDKQLLTELLEAENEDAVMAALQSRKLLQAQNTRWKYLGGMPNNQSIVHNQQSTPAAALVEKVTNALDAILLRHCKAKGIDPRSDAAPSVVLHSVCNLSGYWRG